LHGPRLQKGHGRHQVLGPLARIELREERRRLFVVAGVAAERRQRVGRERHVVRDGEPARHIFDVRIKSAVLVDDDDARQLAARVPRAHEVAAHRARAVRRRIRQVLRVDPRVVLPHLLRPCVVRPQRAEHRGGARAADREFGCAVKKLPAADLAVHVVVEDVEDFLREVARLHSLHQRSPA